MKTVLTAFQAALSSPLNQSNTGRGRKSWKGRGNGGRRGGSRDRGQSQQNHQVTQPQQQNQLTQPTPGLPQQEQGHRKVY